MEGDRPRPPCDQGLRYPIPGTRARAASSKPHHTCNYTYCGVDPNVTADFVVPNACSRTPASFGTSVESTGRQQEP